MRSHMLNKTALGKKGIGPIVVRKRRRSWRRSDIILGSHAAPTPIEVPEIEEVPVTRKKRQVTDRMLAAAAKARSVRAAKIQATRKEVMKEISSDMSKVAKASNTVKTKKVANNPTPPPVALAPNPEPTPAPKPAIPTPKPVPAHLSMLNLPADSLKEYILSIKADYDAWKSRTGPSPAEMNDEERKIAEKDQLLVTLEVGSTYLRVVTEHHGIRTLHSVIVNRPPKVAGKQFNVGDILKPASWRAPATNFTYGNVLSGGPRDLSWTGIS